MLKPSTQSKFSAQIIKPVSLQAIDCWAFCRVGMKPKPSPASCGPRGPASMATLLGLSLHQAFQGNTCPYRLHMGSHGLCSQVAEPALGLASLAPKHHVSLYQAEASSSQLARNFLPECFCLRVWKDQVTSSILFSFKPPSTFSLVFGVIRPVSVAGLRTNMGGVAVSPSLYSEILTASYLRM